MQRERNFPQTKRGTVAKVQIQITSLDMKRLCNMEMSSFEINLTGFQATWVRGQGNNDLLLNVKILVTHCIIYITHPCL